jgi:hypothetical protein
MLSAASSRKLDRRANPALPVVQLPHENAPDKVQFAPRPFVHPCGGRKRRPPSSFVFSEIRPFSFPESKLFGAVLFDSFRDRERIGVSNVSSTAMPRLRQYQQISPQASRWEVSAQCRGDARYFRKGSIFVLVARWIMHPACFYDRPLIDRGRKRQRERLLR